MPTQHLASRQTPTMVLDPASPVPLYHQLQKALEQTWRAQFGPDDDLATEKEIMDQFNVSRITVRRALEQMIAEEIIHRPTARGRLRWAPVKVRQQLNRLRGFFSDDALASGHHPRTRVLEVSQGVWPHANRFLGLTGGEQCYRISRLHESDGKPLSHQISIIPCSVCPALVLSDLSGSIVQMLETRYGHAIRHAEQRLIAREATPEELALLQLPRRAHVFEIDRVSYTDNGRAVEYFVSVLDIVQYEFVSSMDAPVSPP
jgi:GntR family transcriptional regulator